MIGAFVCQFVVLGIRGELRGKCPLDDFGEICLFLAWSLTLFYLVTGSTYRLSLLGVFTAPVVVLLQLLALFPGALDPHPEKVGSGGYWLEAHAAISVLSYGALGLAAIAGVMFFVENRLLKKRQLEGDLMRSMPSINRLVKAMGRITLVGWIVLTVGVVAGFYIEGGRANVHLVTASVTWALYGALLAIYFVRGLPGKQLASGVVALFVLSLLVFAKI